MAVANLKVQLEFRIGGEGFSEVYYHAGSNPEAFRASANALAAERVKLLVAVGNLHHIRVSAAQPGGISQRFQVVNPQGALASTENRDSGVITANVKVLDAIGIRRILQLHGLPDNSFKWDAAGNQLIALPGVVTSYLTYLANQNYQIRYLKKRANDDTLKTIDTITVVDGKVRFFTDTTGYVKGQKILVSGVQGFHSSQFRGVWKIGAIVAGPPAYLETAGTRRVDPIFQYVASSGKVRDASTEGYGFTTITNFEDFMVAGSRRTGRPTDSHRGRRSSR